MRTPHPDLTGLDSQNPSIFLALTQSHPAVPDLEKENLLLRQASGKVQALLHDATRQMNDVLQSDLIRENTPLEVWTAMDLAADAIGEALRLLEAAAPKKSPAAPSPGAPTRQQGQFLAFIGEYMMRNHAGVAPTHAALQKFFNLTAPSVNSMLIRLEGRGFIRRIPHQARGIELTVEPELIPPLDRPFKV